MNELEEIRFCGHLLEIEPDEDNITGRIIMQPLEEYYELKALKRDRKRRRGTPRDIYHMINITGAKKAISIRNKFTV